MSRRRRPLGPADRPVADAHRPKTNRFAVAAHRCAASKLPTVTTTVWLHTRTIVRYREFCVSDYRTTENALFSSRSSNTHCSVGPLWTCRMTDHLVPGQSIRENRAVRIPRNSKPLRNDKRFLVSFSAVFIRTFSFNVRSSITYACYVRAQTRYRRSHNRSGRSYCRW